MEVIRVEKGNVVARRQDKVNEWYLVKEGMISQIFGFAEVKLEANSMIGILDGEWFICDYVAVEDSILIVIPCENASDLKDILSVNETYRSVFLQAALRQRHRMLSLYGDLQKKCRRFQVVIGAAFGDYKSICNQLLVQEQPFVRMEGFEPLEIQHKVENWEISYSNALVQSYMRDYLYLMAKDTGLCVGAIMEAAAQMHRVTQGIREMVNFLQYNKDILFSEYENDMYHLFFKLAKVAAQKNMDSSLIQENMKSMIELIQQLEIYDENMVKRCVNAYINYDFENAHVQEESVLDKDCLIQILTYGGYEVEEIEKIRQMVQDYKNLPDPASTDHAAYQIRKQLSPMFYRTYFKVFLNAVEDPNKMPPAVAMFLNFGFMDTEILGEDYTNSLYHLLDHLGLFQSDHTYTIYDWLCCIYRGEKEPSKNEFDMDYTGYLLDMVKRGKITQEQMQRFKSNREMKVQYEIENLFTSGHRLTYGKLTTFCPILSKIDMINSLEKMALTVEKIDDALNKVRQVDYSVLYREVSFSDPARDVNQEWIMKEVIPDMILMPCAGSRGQMWQEIAGAKKDTPARFLFPMFTITDLDELMVEMLGRYRWEICRRIQGVYWNDIREKSLTAEYCDYLQFYRKNNELSPDAKEKFKIAMTRARNNYREVFTRDYINWIRYEAMGSVRLNKVARDILARYCPFDKQTRQELSANPMYQNAFAKLERENERKEQRLIAFYEKYKKAGGEITPDLKENLMFYQR